MATELEKASCETGPALFSSCLTHSNRETGEKKLLLQAFEMFTQASSSLESAFSQLQERVRRLTEELEAKNLELEQSLHEKQVARNYLKTILEKLPCGVFVLDETGNLALCNPMASDVLMHSPGKSFKTGTGHQPFLSEEIRNYLAASVSENGTNEEVEIPFATHHKKRILATSGTPLSDDGGARIGLSEFTSNICVSNSFHVIFDCL